MSKRAVKNDISYDVKTGAVDNLQKELDVQVATGKFKYLLAHADDGVIWGYVEDKTLKLSTTEFPELSPQLRPETLWEARLFGDNAEWHVWKSDNNWQTCTVSDAKGGQDRAFDEQYILWGTDKLESKNGFHTVKEADLGIVHAPPIEMKDRHTLKLSVRHYVAHDDNGVAYVKISRLMNLNQGGGQ